MAALFVASVSSNMGEPHPVGRGIQRGQRPMAVVSRGGRASFAMCGAIITSRTLHTHRSGCGWGSTGASSPLAHDFACKV